MGAVVWAELASEDPGTATWRCVRLSPWKGENSEISPLLNTVLGEGPYFESAAIPILEKGTGTVGAAARTFAV